MGEKGKKKNNKRIDPLIKALEDNDQPLINKYKNISQWYLDQNRKKLCGEESNIKFKPTPWEEAIAQATAANVVCIGAERHKDEDNSQPNLKTARAEFCKNSPYLEYQTTHYGLSNIRSAAPFVKALFLHYPELMSPEVMTTNVDDDTLRYLINNFKSGAGFPTLFPEHSAGTKGWLKIQFSVFVSIRAAAHPEIKDPFALKNKCEQDAAILCLHYGSLYPYFKKVVFDAFTEYDQRFNNNIEWMPQNTIVLPKHFRSLLVNAAESGESICIPPFGRCYVSKQVKHGTFTEETEETYYVKYDFFKIAPATVRENWAKFAADLDEREYEHHIKIDKEKKDEI